MKKGVAYCSEKYGGKEFAIHFNKNEAPGYMTGPDAFVGYAVGVRHSHLDCAGYSIDQKYLGKGSEIEKEVRAMHSEATWRVITNSLVTCLFARGAYTPEFVTSGLRFLGYDIDQEKLLHIGRVIHGMKFILKERLGFSFDKLELPKKLTTVYTSRGMLTEEDFTHRVQLYKSLVAEDVKLAEEYLSNL